MKRQITIDLTEDTPDTENQPLWKRAHFFPDWNPPRYFPEICNQIMHLYHHEGHLDIYEFTKFITPYPFWVNDQFHPNFWLDPRYNHQTRTRNYAWDCIFAKTLEIYTDYDTEKLVVSTNLKEAKNISDLIPMPVILYLAHPEIIRNWITENAQKKFVCSNFTYMFKKYAWKPNVYTPSKF